MLSKIKVAFKKIAPAALIVVIGYLVYKNREVIKAKLPKIGA